MNTLENIKMEEESIYNLIPREYVPPQKEKRYRSKFPPNTEPTASTFGLKNTSKITNNLAGDYQHFQGAHASKNAGATMGKPKGTVRADPTSFRKRGTGQPTLQQPTKFEYKTERRAPVPRANERPIHGLKSEKNFIVSNAVETILAAPKAQVEAKNYIQKKDFGQQPRYLGKIKQEIEEEYDMIQQLHREQQEEEAKQRQLMTQDEVRELRNGLQRKWEAVQKQYQNFTHVRKFDTEGLRRRKENCEAELEQLEKDMALLDKQYVIVDATR